MLRFLKELFIPKLKCNRIGCKPEKYTRRIRTDGNYEFAAIDYEQTYIECKRCGTFKEEVSREELDYWNGCKMPTEKWDEIKANGYCAI